MKNTLLVLTMLSMLTLCSGCFKLFVPVATPWPEINVPSKPVVQMPKKINPDSTTEVELTDVTFQYLRHIEMLEEAIRKHNANAAAHNDRVEKALYGK